MPRCAAMRMVPPGVSYIPRDFMPTKRFSTRSSRPMPLTRPSSCSRASSHGRLERVIGELEAHLIVALPGCSMRNRVCPHPLGNLDLLLGDQRARNRRAEQILALVKRVGAEHREHVVADELLAQILDKNVLRLDAEQKGLLARRLDPLVLAEIGRE